LDNLKVPDKGFDVVQDISQPKLRLYITSRGVKTFFVRKRVHGKDVRIIIGNYQSFDIENARDKAIEILNSITKKPKSHRKKIGFRKFLDLYLSQKVRRTEKSKTKLIRSINLHLAGLFEKNLQDISTNDISNVLSEISGPAISNRTHELLNSVFKFAVNSDYLKNNPMSTVAKIQEHRRVRRLNKTDLNKLIRAIKKEKFQNMRCAFLMLIYGFANKSKIFSMQWRDLDFNHDDWAGIPLSDLAVVLLSNLPQNGKWVFTGRSGGHLTDPRSAWKKLTTDANAQDIKMDDVYKFLSRKLVWSSDTEIYRNNMNELLADLINK
jgi:integrase